MEPILAEKRLEVMRHVGNDLTALVAEYLRPIEENWQPSEFLPDACKDNFFDEVRLIQESCRDLPYDFLAILISEAITEEALPTYQSWLMDLIGVDQVHQPSGWAVWVRNWSAEENRHGDLLNKYLYLSGRVNMHAMEISTQYLIADGFNIGTDRDPYRNFIYTSFQELATNLSHRRTATLAKKFGNSNLSRLCGVIASDEMRHAKAYKTFVSKILEVDPSELILALEDMMRKKIVMPSHFLRETGVKIGETFSHFSDAAQRLGVYTTRDYIEILEGLLIEWKIGAVRDINSEAEKARDYLMALPARLTRVAERTRIPEVKYKFSWIS